MADPPENQTSTSGTKGQSDKDVTAISGPHTIAAPQSPPPHAEDRDSRNQRRWTNDPAMFWVTLAGVLAVIAYTSVAAWQACLTRDQLAVLEADQRPWVKISNIEIPEITFWKPRPKTDFPDGRIDVRINARVTNIGKSPADSIKFIPVAYATGSNPTEVLANSARKVLRTQLLAADSTVVYNQILFPQDFFDEKEFPVATDSLKIPGTLDFNGPNDFVSVHVLIGVRYKVGKEVGYTISPVDALSVATDTSGQLRWQLSVMKAAQPTYKAGADYMTIVQTQGVEAH
jgi:hypothetical protein